MNAARPRSRIAASARSGSRAALGAIAAATLAIACGDAASPPGDASAALPDIVLVTLDTTRADHLGAYGYFRPTSPRFDAFAAESIVFDQLVVPMATTLPSHLSILTSSHPLVHGVLANTTQGGERFVPAPGLESFAVAARAAGYATGGFVSAAVLKRGTGIEEGFDVFDQPEDKSRRGDGTADAAIAWLASLDDAKPYFLWVHFYDAHYPFDVPDSFATRFHSDADLDHFIRERAIHPTATRPLVGQVDDARVVANEYDRAVAFQDVQLGRVLDAVRGASGRGGRRAAAVVVTGDHGEGLCQHGEAAHGSTWAEQLHAPLAMRIPGESPRRESALLTSSDILTTLLPRLGTDAFDAYLAAALGHDALAAQGASPPVLSQDTGRSREVPFKYALTHDGFKYFRIEYDDGRVEERLYDLGVDPFELRDVSSTFDEVLARMRERTLAEIATRLERAKQLRGDAPRTEAGAVDEKLLSELCALGYIEAERCADRAKGDGESAGAGEESASGE
ncbi:MAG: sulfatase-like hydrolase/transferase [Myxococcales bacterium]|nr:sulfatase-like hydrolase/transferase [Myxococcales bacterium]